MLTIGRTLAGAVLLGLAAGISSAGQNVDPRQALLEKRRAVLEEGLHSAAVAFGGRYEASVPGPDMRMPDLADLVRSSPLAVRALPTAAKAALTQDGKGIYTYYTIEILEIVKGGGISSRVVVRTLGGEMTFDDGSVARVNVDGQSRIEVGKPHLLFLKAVELKDDGTNAVDVAQGVLEVTWWGIGGFALDTDTGVKPLSDHNEGLKGVNVNQFVGQVRALSSK